MINDIINIGDCMHLKVDKNYINYYDNDIKSEKALVFLHGWGQSKDMMAPLSNKFHDIRTICIDLPGFNNTTNHDVLSVYDYANTIKKFLDELNINSIILVGHSFGGKIALVFASLYDVDGLVVLGAPYKRTKISLLKRCLFKLSSFVKFDFARKVYIKLFGSTDYKNANESLRKVLKDTVSTSITDDIKKIKAPTLLIWGTCDDVVPIQDAYFINSLIDDSAVIEIQGKSHYAYLEEVDLVYNVIKKFIEEE